MMKKLFILLLASILFKGCSRPEESLPPGEGNIIVLMYHKIVNGHSADLYERSLNDFENDLKYLRENNIKVISFREMNSLISKGKMPQEHSAVLTFDDGDSSWYTLAMPLLKQYNLKATFFLYTDMIGHASYLSWNEVEEMANYKSGRAEGPFIFGSHTCSHAFLYDSKDSFGSIDEYNSFLDYELKESKNIIESHVPGMVTFLSLPYGDGAGDPDIIAAAKRNGYKMIRTSVWGAVSDTAVDFYKIPSLPILNNTTPDIIGSYLNQ